MIHKTVVCSLQGNVAIPGDKSITHRAIMFGAIAEGETVAETSLLGRDNFATARIMRQLGAGISGEVTKELHPIAVEEGLGDLAVGKEQFCILRILGKGLHGLTAPREELNCGNSGTTARLLTGLLAGQAFSARLNGDHSLVKRPFRRVTEPLSEMGARFSAENLPFEMSGGKLTGINFISPKASAQVKSAILLAGLYADGTVSVTEPRLSRDHTERMFSAMGCKVRSTQISNGAWKIELPTQASERRLSAIDIQIPGDFSAAAFFLVAGSIFPGSQITVKNVGINPSRTGLFHVLNRMGAKLENRNQRVIGGEDVVDIDVVGSALRGVHVTAEDVVLGIDEMPILAVAAAVAEGVTEISGAEELRVKESDRLAMIINILQDFGVEVEEKSDGAIIHGNPALIGRGHAREASAAWRSSGDHRIAMSGGILELLLTGAYRAEDTAAVETSFPSFYSCLETLSGIKPSV